MTQGETIFKRKVLKDLKKLPRCYVLKTQERSRRGVLDLILCLSGLYVSIELKIPGEKPEPLQDVNIRRVKNAGGIAFWTDPEQWPAHLKLLGELAQQTAR